MKKRSKWIIVLGIFVVILLYVTYIYRSRDVKIGMEYTRGKTPGSFLVTFRDNYLIYKDDVLIEGDYENQGLYIKNIDSDYENGDDILLSNDFYISPNVYKDWVYFVDNKNNLKKIKLDGSGEVYIIEGDNKTISDILVIEDTMYFIRNNEFEKNSLYAMSLNTNEIIEVEEDVNFRYLYDYCGSACVISSDRKRIIIYNYENGQKQTYDNLETEIQGFLSNGSIIHYNNNKIYMRNSFESKKDTILVELENIYRIIVHNKDMVIATLNEYGVIQVYEYNYKKDKLQKIANANHPPRDYNDTYIACLSDSGFGNVELINRQSGNIKIFSFK